MLLSVGCGSTFTVSTEKIIPPKRDVRKYKTVAIEMITEDSNQAFTNPLIQNFLKEKRMKVVQRNDTRPLFERKY